MTEDRLIRLDPKNFEKAKKKVDSSNGEFNSIEEFVNFVLDEILKEDSSETPFDKNEQADIESKLKSLGYI